MTALRAFKRARILFLVISFSAEVNGVGTLAQALAIQVGPSTVGSENSKLLTGVFINCVICYIDMYIIEEFSILVQNFDILCL